MQTQIQLVLQQFCTFTKRQMVSLKPPLQVRIRICVPSVHTDTKAVDCSNSEAAEALQVHHVHMYIHMCRDLAHVICTLVPEEAMEGRVHMDSTRLSNSLQLETWST